MSDDNLFAQLDSGMSMEELGSSLLDRKAKQQKAQARADEKAQKITNILAGLTAGQVVFKKALGNRMKELDEQETFILSNNAQQAKDINSISRVVSFLPKASWFEDKGEKSVEEWAELYSKEYAGGYEGIKDRFRPVVDELLKNSFASDTEFNSFKASGEYNAALENSVNKLLTNYFEVGKDGNRRYMNFESDLRNLLDAGDMERVDLYKRGINLKVDELSEAEKRILNNYRAQYRDKGFISGFKDSLRRIGIMNESKGGMNLFENVDNMIMDSEYLIDRSLKDLSLGGHIVGDLDRYMAEYRTSNKQFLDQYNGDEKFQLRLDNDIRNLYNSSQQYDTPYTIEEQRFAPLHNKRVKAARTYDKLHILRIAGDDDFMERYFGDLIEGGLKNPEGSRAEAYGEFRKDVGQLSLAFLDDPEFAVRAYRDSLAQGSEGMGMFGPDANAVRGDPVKGFNVDEQTVAEFREELMNNESFRNKFAAALLIRHGMLDGGGFFQGKRETYNFDTDGKIYKMYQDLPESQPTYTESSTHKQVNLGLGKGIDLVKGKFVTTDDWDTFNENEKKQVFNNHMYGLFHNPLVRDVNMRLQMMNFLYEQNFNPYTSVYDDFNDYLTDLSASFKVQ